ncbi:MAG: hypothetical protein CVU21_24915 [Betaproteobacteria bacterium HGW-Betaproteobacteria-15]|nr:MAG: hypothetical protein CVU21_24915 [Betaproteobacteria bacterium HGW-Betaproteobacteria-15]
MPVAKRRDSASGSPFLCLLSFGEAKERRSAAGPRPGQTKLPEKTKKKKKRAPPKRAKNQTANPNFFAR